MVNPRILRKFFFLFFISWKKSKNVESYINTISITKT
nr:MAG TPA: hypothetical protein [Caudoviricetes sp.]